MQLSAREAVLHDFNGKRGPYRAMQPRSIDCQARFFSKCAAIVPPTPKRKKGYKHKLATLLFCYIFLVRLPEPQSALKPVCILDSYFLIRRYGYKHGYKKISLPALRNRIGTGDVLIESEDIVFCYQ